MPTFDGGHYFLTVLVPVKTDPVRDGSTFTSPVHALRKRLAKLPPAQQTPASRAGQSPFARNTRNHFARFVVIDNVAYNGRQTENSIYLALRNLLGRKTINLVAAQPQDYLTCPFLLFTAEFDAASGTGAERDSYLESLWDTMEPELREIFTHCERFDSVNDAASFATYIARGQIETTMSFNDYYLDPPDLPAWPAKSYGKSAFGGLALVALGLVVWFFSAGWGLLLLLLGALALGGVIWLAYASLMAAGAKPFPPAADLPAVLKALHLQRTFTRFAIDNRLLVVDPASAPQLHAAFRDFVTVNQPDNLGGPTQPPGVIGI